MSGPGTKLVAAGLLLVVAACAPARQGMGPANGPARLTPNAFIAADGAYLPVRVWLPAGRPKAVILAVHGMNDHSRAFALPAAAWRKRGIATYAYDQRGFGGGPHRGIWAGVDAMLADLRAMARLVRARHPGVAFYLLGASMGGGVVLAALGEANPPHADGAILVAPAVWGRKTMPAYYPPALWLAAHTIPYLLVTANDINRVPTDNVALLRELTRDPRVIKATRVDAGYGVANLMDRALAASGRIAVPVLVLYGEKDRIIPKKPTLTALERMPRSRRRVALYAEGWHMLLRDLQRAVVHRDIAAWIKDRAAPLPSGADKRDIGLLAKGVAVRPE